jgi:uncharacterized BrkB/YihY/UPF0761 family membrane protein
VSKAIRVLARFLGELIRAQHRDQLLLRAGALAYTTLLSLVPLLTVVLVTVSRVQPERFAVVVQAFAAVLPFSPARVQATLTSFAERTAALGWIAVAISVALTFNAFYQIEEVINDIWGVPSAAVGSGAGLSRWSCFGAALLPRWARVFTGCRPASGTRSSRRSAPLPAILGAVVLPPCTAGASHRVTGVPP